MTETITQALSDRADQATIARSRELVPADTKAVAAVSLDQEWWTEKQRAALVAMGIKNATKEELLLFLHYCQKTRLDPFSKQIYMIERKNKNKDTGQYEYSQVIQVGIDGFRVGAQRAAWHQGINIEYEPTVWFDDKGGTHEVWLDNTKPPAAARVVVVKVLANGAKLRVPGVAKFESYAAYGENRKTGERWLQSQWKVMPDHMIEKCAEAFALRRAFPNDLGGLYVEEELQNGQYQPMGSPPKMEPRERDVQADDDGVIRGTVEPGTQPATGSPESNGEATAPDPKVSVAKIAAVLREHGLGARDKAALRLAIVSGIWAAMTQAGEPTEYVKVDKLAPEVVAQLADAVAAFSDGLSDGANGSVKDQLTAYGERVQQQVTAHDQQNTEE